jgi:hypothetical protein
MLNETNEEMKFVIKVNGQARSKPLIRTLAEQALQNLPEDERVIAELVPVTPGGQELLLG